MKGDCSLFLPATIPHLAGFFCAHCERALGVSGRGACAHADRARTHTPGRASSTLNSRLAAPKLRVAPACDSHAEWVREREQRPSAREWERRERDASPAAALTRPTSALICATARLDGRQQAGQLLVRLSAWLTKWPQQPWTKWGADAHRQQESARAYIHDCRCVTQNKYASFGSVCDVSYVCKRSHGLCQTKLEESLGGKRVLIVQVTLASSIYNTQITSCLCTVVL
jgi:hypothetical protein